MTMDSEDKEKSDLPKSLKKAESYAKIFSLIALPLLVAIGGWIVQHNVTANAIRGEYVKIAVQVLSENNDIRDFTLRRWAADTLNHYSEVSFTAEELINLKEGRAAFPKTLGEDAVRMYLDQQRQSKEAWESIK